MPVLPLKTSHGCWPTLPARSSYWDRRGREDRSARNADPSTYADESNGQPGDVNIEGLIPSGPVVSA